MIGQTILHYKILGKLGEGGMGVVYKAEDTKLKRTVALKFLPPELTRDPEAKARFIREAQAASSLDHSNICTIYEIGETKPALGQPGEGQLFIVMACYEGKTLKEKIKDQRLKIKEAVDIAVQIAEGLKRAHEAGIVHRDIKPANIMITERGEVKILDFGLAKLAGQAQLTKDSSTLGTVAYMSPEQLSGKEVDPRTDIWSLGVILYEILSRELPFKGDYEQAIMYAILNEEPKTLEDIPVELQGVVEKALQKNVDKRYSEVFELLNDLTAIMETHRFSKPVRPSPKSTRKKIIVISAVAVLIIIAAIAGIYLFPTSESETPIKSLAVLPFYNIKADPETNFLSFALADQIIGKLNYLQNMNARASSSVRKYENKKVNPQKIGNELDVEFVLSGSYLFEGRQIRLNVELVEVQSNNLLWRNELEVNYENAFQLQDIVADNIRDRLEIQFAPAEQNRMEIDVPQNSLAYEYLLRSKSYPLSVEGSILAVEMLKKSIELDSTYAPAYADLGYHKIRLAQHKIGGSESNYLEAEKYLLKALNLNQDQFEALIQLAGYYTDRGKPEEALTLVRRALQINPNSAWAHYRLGYVCRYTGLLQEAEQAVELVLQSDPFNERLGAMSDIYLDLGKYQKTLKVTEIYKVSLSNYYREGKIFILLNQKDEALRKFDRYIEKEPESLGGLLSLALKNYILGKYDTGLEAVRKLDESGPMDSAVLFLIAESYAVLEDSKNSLRVLRQAVEGGFFCYPFFLSDPFLDPVRDDPEFQKVLALAKEKHEAFKQLYFAEKE
jgi:serine/threonine protein kinase/Tfp pilus assembly protein PilF